MRKGGVPGKEVKEKRRKADKDKEGYAVVVVVSGWHSRRFVSSFFLHCTFLSPAAPIPTAPSSVIAPNASTMKRSTLLATLSAHVLLSAIIYSRLYFEQRDRPISLHCNHTLPSRSSYTISNETFITCNLKTTTQQDSMLKDRASIYFFWKIVHCQVSSGPNYVRYSYFHSDSVYLGSSMQRKDIPKGILYENLERNLRKSIRRFENDRFEWN